MRLAEPVTTLTDYLLAVEIVFFGILLLRTNPSIPVRIFAFAFFVLAVAAAAGGTYHGLMERMNPVTSHAIWKVTLYGVGVATLLMLSATVLAYLPAPWNLIFLAITFIQFVLYLYVISGSNDFRYVIYNYLPAMIAILCMAGYHRNLWLVGAVLISFAGAAVQRSGIVLHKHLNFNDLYHFIQMVGMYFFYRGGRLL